MFTADGRLVANTEIKPRVQMTAFCHHGLSLAECFALFWVVWLCLYVAAKDKQAPSLEQVLTHSATPPHPPPPPHAATTTITKNFRIALVEEVLLRGDRVFLAF